MSGPASAPGEGAITHLRPYDLGRVHWGDARELLRQVPAGRVTMVFMDPPYGHHNNGGVRMSGDNPLSNLPGPTSVRWLVLIPEPLSEPDEWVCWMQVADGPMEVQAWEDVLPMESSGALDVKRDQWGLLTRTGLVTPTHLLTDPDQRAAAECDGWVWYVEWTESEWRLSTASDAAQVGLIAPAEVGAMTDPTAKAHPSVKRRPVG